MHNQVGILKDNNFIGVLAVSCPKSHSVLKELMQEVKMCACICRCPLRSIKTVTTVLLHLEEYSSRKVLATTNCIGIDSFPTEI